MEGGGKDEAEPNIPEKVSSCMISASCGLCNCCGACLLFCLTATFWAYYDKNGMGTITQKSVFLGFSITYVIIAIFVAMCMYSALMSMGRGLQFIEKAMQGIPGKPNIPGNSSLVHRVNAGTKSFKQKWLRQVSDNITDTSKNEMQDLLNNTMKEIQNTTKTAEKALDLSWVKKSIKDAFHSLQSALAHHMKRFLVLVIFSIVSFSICWAFVTTWNGDKDKDTPLFVAAVLSTLVTIVLCCVLMCFGMWNAYKDASNLAGLLPISSSTNLDVSSSKPFSVFF